MLLDELVQTIETLKQRISDYGTELRQSEALTRYALIDSLLRELGWDLEDPAQVRPEYSGAGGGFADYALFGDGAMGKPAAMLEAKSLDTPLTSNVVNQAFQYCFQIGIGHMVITNGNHWRWFDLLTPGLAIEKREMASVTLTTDPAHQCALKLLALWRPNLASGQPIAASEPILSVASQPGETAQAPQTVATPPPPPSGEGWTSLVEFQPGASNQPPRIHLPDGTEKQLQYWYRLLMETAGWLIRTGHLTTEQCPVTNNGKVSIVNTEPQHQSGNAFFRSHQLSNGLYLNRHGNKKTLLDYTQSMLKGCHQDPDSVQLRFN